MSRTPLKANALRWIITPIVLCGFAYVTGTMAFAAYEKMIDVPFSAIDECLEEETPTSYPTECVKGAVRSLISRHGVHATLAYIISPSASPELRNTCHAVAHIIGQVNYRQVGSLEPALSRCSSECQYGCVHGTLGTGVLDELGEVYPEEDIAHADAETIARLGSRYCEGSIPLCHGIGHVLYILNAGSETDLGMDVCERIAGGYAREVCYQGIFMERAGARESVLPFKATSTFPVRTNDYAYPCLSIPAQPRHACFQFLPLYQNEIYRVEGTTRTSDKIRISTETCERMSRNDRAACFEGMGINAHIYVRNAASVEELGHLCNDMPELADRAACSIGIIPRDFFVGGYGLNYCASIDEGARRRTCFDASFRWMEGIISGSEIRTECSEAIDTQLCTDAYASYLARKDSLPDYRFGLFGQ